MTAKEILDFVGTDWDYSCYGIRADRPGLEPGFKLDPSKNMFQDWHEEWWGDIEENEADHPLDEETGCYIDRVLDGTCAVWFDHSERAIEKVIERVKRVYCPSSGEAVYLIAGDDDEEGNDVDEIVIKNAVVIARIA